MSKKKKIIIIIIALLVMLAVAGGLFWYFNKDQENPSQVVQNEDMIKEYGYTIKKRDSKLKKQKFKELKEILKEKDVDFDLYAKKLAEIFAVDVYDLNSKVNKYDIGGLEYVINDKKSEFKILLQDTLYSNIKDNVDSDRNQTLPIVTAANATDLDMGTYKYQESEQESYDVKIKIDYKEDLGYDSNVLIKMIKKENKLFIVVVEPD